MPVTFQVALHKANPHTKWSGYHDAEEILLRTAPKASENCCGIIQTSVGKDDLPSVVGQENGFVHACLKAYNQHHNLIIRPDDLWFSILSQFSLYVNGHSEEMRDYFVAHQGHKELRIDDVGTSHGSDFGKMAQKFTHLLHDNLKDKGLQKWILPDFTTTTLTDTICGSIAMMTALKAFFKYYNCITCGIPQVTLLGERGDYEKILQRLDKLSGFGAEDLKKWGGYLQPILSRIVGTFDVNKDGAVTAESVDFWGRICHVDMGSGTDTMSGWLSVFCTFDSEGKYQLKGPTAASLEVPNAVPYASIDLEDIPPGTCEVPVTFNDSGFITETTMVAGLIGYKLREGPITSEPPAPVAKESGSRKMFKRKSTRPVALTEPSTANTELNTVQPYMGWFIFINKASRVEEHRAEMKALKKKHDEEQAVLAAEETSRGHKRNAGEGSSKKEKRISIVTVARVSLSKLFG